MNDQTMDRLAKSVAGGLSRRRFLRRASGTLAAGVAAVGLGEQARWAKALSQAGPEEQSVILFEKLAEIVDEHAISCVDLTAKVLAFHKANQDLLTRIRAEQGAWSDDQRTAHAKTYGDRRWAAATKIQAASARCLFSAKSARQRRAQGHTRPATPGAATPNSAAMGWIPFAAELNALPATQSAPQSCPDTLTVECINPNTRWSSPETWTVSGTCTSPVDCTFCGESAETCAEKYPDHCGGEYAGQCGLSWITNTSCIYTVTAECINPNTRWGSPESWTVPAACTSPTDCTICGESNDFCAEKYPDQCGGSYSGQCGLSWITNTSCTYPVQAVCANPNTRWISASWNTFGTCNSDQSSCTPCQSNDVCAAKFPAQCGGEDAGQCGVEWMEPTPPSSCCQNNCPISTSDCVGNGIGSIFGDANCNACMLSWCGSTAKCYEYCGEEDCCNEACSEAPVPPPAGEGKTAGTPVPSQGTPAVSTPTPIPTPRATVPPTAPPTIPPTAPPTTTPTPPPTVPPTTPPGTPTAAPPPATTTATS